MDKKDLFDAYRKIYSMKFGDMGCLKINCSLCEYKLGFSLLLPYEHEFIEKISKRKINFKKKIWKNNVFYIVDECNFFKDGKCSVHQNRPITCRSYPFDIAVKNQKLILFIDTNCPLYKKIIKSKRKKEIIRMWNYLIPVLGKEYWKKWNKTPYDSGKFKRTKSIKKVGEFYVLSASSMS